MNITSKDLAYCGTFGAAALLLPVIFHLLHLGHIFMPMYLPLVALAFFTRGNIAALTAFITPLISGALSGMPPFYPPIAPVMALELALMVLLINTVRGRWPRLPTIVILIPILLFGRILNAALFFGIASLTELPAGFVATISFISGWPGIILMLIVIPKLIKLRSDLTRQAVS